jgi:hypothetical protein
MSPNDLPGDFQDEQGGVATEDQNGADEQVAADAVPMGELTVQAPDGAHFEFSPVKTNRGQVNLGEVPILVWDSITKAVEFYGEDAALAAFNNTGLRVPFQSIARRGRVSGKLDANGIAQEELEYKPGQVERQPATAASRAKSAAAKAAEALGEDGADTLTTLMQKFASGEVTLEQLKAAGLI